MKDTEITVTVDAAEVLREIGSEEILRVIKKDGPEDWFTAADIVGLYDTSDLLYEIGIEKTAAYYSAYELYVHMSDEEKRDMRAQLVGEPTPNEALREALGRQEFRGMELEPLLRIILTIRDDIRKESYI